MTDRYTEALEALRFRYEGTSEDAIFTVHTYTEEEHFTTQRHRNTPAEWEAVAHQFAGHEADVWTRITTVGPNADIPRHGRGKEADTAYVSVLHVDIDPEPAEGESMSQWQERKLEELHTFYPLPSRIEFSGRGYYALWKLTEPTTDWQRAKRINKWLADQIGGDHCWDVARILRLPGTKNPKPGAGWSTLCEANDALRYRLEDFEESDFTSAEKELESLDIQPEVIPLDFPAQCRAASEKLWDRIYSEATAREIGASTRKDRSGLIDRSENDFHIACALLRMGQSPGVVYSVLTHPEWYSGEKFRESGYRDSYVLHTIRSADAMTEAEPIKAIVPLANRIIDKNTIRNYLKDWFWYDTSRGVYVPGDVQVRQAIHALSGEKWRPDLQSGTLTYLESHVDVHRYAMNDTRLLNVRNAMIDVKSGKTQTHSPTFNSTLQINAEWNENVDTTEVDAFVGQLLSPASIEAWWMFCGYCLYTETPLPYRGILFLVGPRRTGKSTLLNALAYFLGEENCSSVSLTELTEERTQFTTSNLIGKLLNSDTEADYQKPIRQFSLLKAIGSGEPLDIEKKYAGKQRMPLPVKLAFAMNGYPKIGTPDSALTDRMLMLSMRSDQKEFSMGNSEMVANAHLRLLSKPQNRSAWLKRSIEGLKAAHANKGIPETEEMQQTKLEMLVQEDSVVAFWQMATVRDFGYENTLSKVHHAYQEWAAGSGITHSASVQKFVNRTKELASENSLDATVQHNGQQWTVKGRKPSIGGFRVKGQ